MFNAFTGRFRLFVPYREISFAAEKRAQLTPDITQATGLIMSFLTLCCKTSPRLCCGISVSALLSTVTIYVSRMNTSYLSCHVLTLFSSLEGLRGIPRNKIPPLPWEIALSCPRSDIIVACKSAHSCKFLKLEFTSGSACLASCVLAREHLQSLHISAAVGIWDYLRDVLLLILTGHYIGDEAPLGFLVAPTVCEGLLGLLHKSGDPFGNDFLTSFKDINSDSL